jgi:hypothetical protein
MCFDVLHCYEYDINIARTNVMTICEYLAAMDNLCAGRELWVRKKQFQDYIIWCGCLRRTESDVEDSTTTLSSLIGVSG